MRDEEVFLMVVLPGLCVGAAFLLSHSKRVHEQKMKRLDVLQEALRHPSLGDDTRADLVRLLSEEHRREAKPLMRWVRSGWRLGHVLLLAVSWLLMVGGAASWGIGRLSGWSSYSLQPSIYTAVAGFVLMTLPIALREMLRRSGSPSSARQ